MTDEPEKPSDFEVWAYARAAVAKVEIAAQLAANEQSDAPDDIRQSFGEPSVENRENTGNLQGENRQFSGSSEAKK